MLDVPVIEASSEDERRSFIKEKYPCLADCDMCGLCRVFNGKDPENAYDDYIKGIARGLAARQVNTIQLMTYYTLGKWIIDIEQGGEARAAFHYWKILGW